MIGRKATDVVTVKDVPAADFIAAYANHLKKANRITLPEVLSYLMHRIVTSLRLLPIKSLLLMEMTGSMLELVL